MGTPLRLERHRTSLRQELHLSLLQQKFPGVPFETVVEVAELHTGHLGKAAAQVLLLVRCAAARPRPFDAASAATPVRSCAISTGGI
jgi:hypothetical protein